MNRVGVIIIILFALFLTSVGLASLHGDAEVFHFRTNISGAFQEGNKFEACNVGPKARILPAPFVSVLEFYRIEQGG